jgi:hypothetical protein
MQLMDVYAIEVLILLNHGLFGRAYSHFNLSPWIVKVISFGLRTSSQYLCQKKFFYPSPIVVFMA